jgi:phenylalanyl-tRNA synthetase alpha chain
MIMQEGSKATNKLTSLVLDVKNEALAQIVDAKDVKELEDLRIAYLGRNGKLTNLIKEIKDLSPQDRKQAGRLINEVKNGVLEAISAQKNTFKESAREWFDATIPGKKPKIGHLHLVTQAIEEISETFKKIGFVRVRYPEVEWDWFAFEALNIPEGHPARDDWETFFIDAPADSKYGQMCLTPHTSSGQVREMQRVKEPPIRMINIAKCYRRQLDVIHTQMFHQFEGLVVDKGISIVHLKGALDYFARNFFGKDRKTRLRPHHFRFTEPSFEVDISCDICKGKGCKLCKEGWLELGGCGMVHPTVLKNGGIDPKKYTGFAFGWGVERTFMMKSGLEIDDIRLLYSTDLRFLTQF